jgi:hypothetical protein
MKKIYVFLILILSALFNSPEGYSEATGPGKSPGRERMDAIIMKLEAYRIKAWPTGRSRALRWR